MRADDLSGKKFGNLTGLRRVENHGRRTRWLWACDCGKETIADPSQVKSGHTISCGCAWVKKCRKHGHGHNSEGKQTRTYKAWVNMRSRVNPNIEMYKPNYFDRGISVCDRWKDDFIAFLEDMGECPVGMSLDREENDGNYEPSNCRWATPAQQSANRRCTKSVNFRGKIILLLEACRVVGIHPATVQHRLNIGMSVDQALSTPVRKRVARPSMKSLVLERGSEWMIY
jgi:hypothetical protein